MSSERSRCDFTDSTRGELLEELRTRFADRGVVAPDRSAEWILTEVLECDRARLYAYAERPVAPDEANRIARLMERRLEGEPLQYVLGYTEFFGLRIEVEPSVLIPRPETEAVVRAALDLLEPLTEPRILDVGTGSGCIALALADRRRDAAIEGCDRSEAALDVARRNAEALDLPVRLRRADLDDESPLWDEAGSYDLIVSNPPYVPPDERSGLDREVRDFEPAEALFTPGDPLHYYRSLLAHGRGMLGEEGRLLVEVHAGYAEEVRALFVDAGYGEVVLRADWGGRPRVVHGRRPGDGRYGETTSG